MASEYTRNPMRGLLIPDERVTVWAAESSYTQAGPRAPGAVAPTGVSQMGLVAQGTQTAGTSYEILALRGGVARSAAHLAAAYAWRSGASGDYYGWDAPSLLTRVEVPVPVNTGTPTAILYARHPDMLALPSGAALIVYEVRDTSAGSPYQVRVATRAVGGAITHATIYSTTFAVPTDQGYYPAILRLPSARIVVYHWVFDPNGLEANIRAWYSDDDGVTWATGQQYALDQPLSYGTLAGASSGSSSYVVGRLRAAYSLGQVVVLASVTSLDTDLSYRSVMMQAASADYGMTLERVEVWNGASVGPTGADVIATPTGFLAVWVAGADATAADANAPITYARIGSAYEPLSSAASATPTGMAYNISAGVNATATKITSSSGLALTRLGETIYLHYVVDHPSLADHFGAAMYTSDFGASWTGMYGSGSGTVTPASWVDPGNRSVSGGTADKRPMELASCSVNGAVLIASECDGASAQEQSLFLHTLGGYSTVTMPGLARWLDPRRRTSWSHTWVPYDVPGSMAWTAAGAGSSTLDAGYLTVTTAAQTRTHTVVPTGSVALGYVARFSMAAVSGGAVTTNVVGAGFKVADGTNSYGVDIRIGTAGFRIYDQIAGTVIATVTVTTTGGLDVLLGIRSATVSVWYRARDASTQRTWTLAGSSAALTDGGASTSAIAWGHRASGTAVSRWFSFSYTEGAESGYSLADGQTNPDDLHPCPFGSIEGTTIASTIKIHAESGAAVRGDEWTVEPTYDYALSRALPSTGLLSPRWGWRSTSTAAQTIALRLSDIGDTSLGSDLIGIAGFGCNIPRILIHGYDADTSSWVSLATVDLHAGMSGLKWVREGTALRPDTGSASTNTPYLYHEELAGSTFALSDTIARRISHNAEGKWTNAVTRRGVLFVEAESADPTSGTVGYVIPKDWTIIVDLRGGIYSAIRLAIPTPAASIPAPAEAYWEIGALVVGPVVVHADEYGWGRTLDVESGTEITEARDGTRIAVEVQPPRRVVEYGWPDGLDMTAALDPDGDPDPDYVMGSSDASAFAVASRRGTPYQVEGVARRLAGASSGIVYLPRIAKFGASPTFVVVNRRHAHLYGRVTSDVAIESVQGDELENEVVRVAVIRIEEET